MKPSAVFLDAATLGDDLSLDPLHQIADMQVFAATGDDQVVERCRGAAVVVTNKVVFDQHRLRELQPSLRLICLTATGYNNVDTRAAAELGITVCNVRDYSTDSVAQHTLAMTLALLQHLAYYAEFVAGGAYVNAPVFTHFGRPWYELAGKTWGIIGMGAIGRRTAQLAAALGCRVVYYSSTGQNRDANYQRLELEDLLGSSQVVSIHAPLNDRTRNLIAARELELLQPEAVLVNVGRGGIVNETDLAQALHRGLLRGAALDVFVDEPVRPDSPLLHVPSERLLMTPHIAWGSIEARTRVVTGVADNIGAFQAGRPQNVVS